MKRIYTVLLTSAVFLLFVGNKCNPGREQEEKGEPYQWGKELELDTVAVDPDKTYYPKAEGTFRIMSYNVGALHKYIPDLTENVNMVASMITEARADVVGLNELDSCNARCNHYQLKLLAQAAGKWDYFYGKTLDYRGGAYGNGIMIPSGARVMKVSRLCFENKTSYESRGMIVVETDRYVVANTHLDHSSQAYIQSQIAEINTWMRAEYADCDKPVFLCGDMNSRPDSEAIQTLCTVWNIISNTEELTTARSTIDYIFHLKRSAPVEVLGAGTMTRFYHGDATIASDHLPIYADVSF